MKHKLLPVLLTAVAAAAALTVCTSDGEKAKPVEAVNRVYPEGEGKYYDPETQSVEVKTEGTQPATQKKKNDNAKKKTTDPTGTTEPTGTEATIPTDSITEKNLNPNIGDIRELIAEQMKEREVKNVTPEPSSLTMKVGESKKIEVKFEPENALDAFYTVKASGTAVKAEQKDDTITVKALKEGKSTLTVTTRNGCVAVCTVTVSDGKAKQQDETKAATASTSPTAKPDKKQETTAAPTKRVITDDTDLSHSELFTAANMSRWIDALNAHFTASGLRHDPTLTDSSGEINTADLGSGSYNSMEAELISQAGSTITSLTGDAPGDYGFNIFSEPNGNEFTIQIAVKHIENE